MAAMWHVGDNWGWWMLFSVVWSGLFLAAIVWVTLAAADRRDRRTEITTVTPLEILKRRYAAGELTDEEFERMRQRVQRPAAGSVTDASSVGQPSGRSLTTGEGVHVH